MIFEEHKWLDRGYNSRLKDSEESKKSNDFHRELGCYSWSTTSRVNYQMLLIASLQVSGKASWTRSHQTVQDQLYESCLYFLMFL